MYMGISVGDISGISVGIIGSGFINGMTGAGLIRPRRNIPDNGNPKKISIIVKATHNVPIIAFIDLTPHFAANVYSIMTYKVLTRFFYYRGFSIAISLLINITIGRLVL